MPDTPEPVEPGHPPTAVPAEPDFADVELAGLPDDQHFPRKVVLVAGSGRSGTSLMAGILKTLGLHVPEPEVVADNTNPKGFGEPQWVVDFHERLLERAVVHPSDARPSAWFDTGKVSAREAFRAELASWLEEQFAFGEEMVIKDPRLSWFLGLWRVGALRAGASSSTITMLRPPAEVVGSKKTYYGGRLADTTRLAGWVNVMLHTERATRGSRRAFVRYHDLLDDWTSTLFRIGEELDIEHVVHVPSTKFREVHQLVDPGLHRVRQSWEDLSVPASLREVAEQSWEQLNQLAQPGGDTEKVHVELDALRVEYSRLYAEAEAVASSSIRAAGPHALRAARRAREERRRAEAQAASEQPDAPARTAVVRARRAAGRVRRGLRSLAAPKPDQEKQLR